MKMEQAKAIIFDLDGVIVDTAIYHYQAWKRSAQTLGIDFTEEQNELLKGVSRMRSLEIILELGGLTLSDDEKERVAASKNAHYLELISEMKPEDVLPGIREAIQLAKAAGMKTAIGSASKNTRTILRQTEIEELFDAIVDGNKVTNAKPDPEVFLKAAAELGVAPGYCIVIEDAQAGVEAAKKAGMFCIGIGKPEVLTLADVVVASPELIALNDILDKRYPIANPLTHKN